MEKIKSFLQKPIVVISVFVGSLILLCISCSSLWFYASGAPITEKTAVAGTISAWTPFPTQTAYPTYTSVPTIFITKIVIVTPAFTSTPLNTPTPSHTPTITATPLPPTSTPNKSLTATAQIQAMLQADKDDGFYLVGIDIAPGVWRSTGTGDSCYWGITTKTGDILENHFGMSGGTAYISPSAFQVEFNDCGIWIFVSGP